MTAFDTAWELLKAPIYDYPEDISSGEDPRFTMMPDMRMVSLEWPNDETSSGEPFYWQSKDTQARGTMRPEHGRIYIDNFEIAYNLRSQGLAEGYLQEMIDEAIEQYGDRPVHVGRMNANAVGFWDKMARRGTIQGFQRDDEEYLRYETPSTPPIGFQTATRY